MKAKEINRLKSHDKMLLAANGLNQRMLESDTLLGVCPVEDWPKRALNAEEQQLVQRLIQRCELVLRRAWDGGKSGPYSWIGTERLEKEIDELRAGLDRGGAAG